MHKRDEIIAAIKKCAERLGRAPSQAEFRRASKISWYQVYKHFRGMRQAVRAAGLEPGPRGGALDVNALALDWARVVRKLGRLPSRAEYSEHGIHHAGTLHARIVWSQMAHKFVLLVREFHLEREWADVVKTVVSKFPLLETSIQRSALGTQPEESNWQSANSNWQKPFTAEDAEPPHQAKPVLAGGPGDAKENFAADWRRETQIGEVDRELTRSGTNENREPQSAQRRTGAGEMPEPECLPLMATDRQHSGMKLGKVVAAALAIEILMAMERSAQQSAQRSIQPSALSSQPEGSNRQLEGSNRQLANSNWQDQNQDQNQNVERDEDQNLEPQRAQSNTEEMHELADRHGALADGQAPCGRAVVYGEPLGLAAMAHAPTNELGVLFLFGIVAADLGFRVERLQAAFPDCEAKREVAPGKWELVFIELEIYSRNFKLHRHNPRGCHAIVCWKHNWPDCPEWLEVIELSKVVKRLGEREIG